MWSSQEEHRVAFIRHKKVHGYVYYQAVRNYRDSHGEHRQEVLCHLGKHNCLDAAIAAERTAAKIAEESAFLRSMSVRSIGAHIENSYPERARERLLVLCDEDIPGILNDVRKELSEYEWYLTRFGDIEYELQVEELDMEREFLEMCLEYCNAAVLEVEARKRARRHE